MDLKKLADQLELDENEYIELLELFAETGAKDIDRLEKALEFKNAAEAERAAHSLKGASSSLGLNDISEPARMLEKNARESLFSDNVELLKSIKEKFSIIKNLV